MAGEQFSLCWDNFHKNMSAGMHALLENEDLVDVTIAIEGKYLKAHKMVLSVCSPYFKELFQSSPCKHPIVFLKDVSYVAMNDLLTFMYQGEVQVNQEHLTAFIKTAEALQIKGLTGEAASEPAEIIDDHQDISEETIVRQIPLQHEQKHTPRPKKVVAYSNKRPRHTPNAESKMAKLEHCTPAEIIQFKMEPFEAEQSQHDDEHFEGIDDVQAEAYRDDALDETHLDEGHIDDPEDYSILEGDEEPKPGTSTEPGGESQDGLVQDKTAKQVRKFHRIVQGGFFYNISTTRIGNKRYYRCANKKSTGCLATAALHNNDPLEMLVILRPHNHPPDTAMEIKYNFEMELTKAVKNSDAPIRVIYETLAQIYPEAAKLVKYNNNLFTRLKRRRASSFYESL